MRTPYTVFIMFKKQVGSKEWEITDYVYLDRQDGKAAAKRFTDDSIGWKFSTRAFKEIV